MRKAKARNGGESEAPLAVAVGGTTSYARVMENGAVKQQVDTVAEPIERSYQNVIHELRDRNAVGVVVAVNGEIIWADIFASTELLEKTGQAGAFLCGRGGCHQN